MGIRIAKLDTGYDGLEMWCVYQSVTDALFSPIFYDELSAQIYAHHYYQTDTGHADWRDEYKVGELVTTFVRRLYGEEPENNPAYTETLEAVQLTYDRRGERELHNLWTAFSGWRLDQNKAPVFVLTEGGENEC